MPDPGIVIEEVDLPPGGGGSPGQAPPPGATQPRNISLAEIDAQVGGLYVPSYVPQGLNLSESWVDGGKSNLRYKSGNASGANMRVMQFTVAPRPHAKRGSVETVTVGGESGKLIRGAWLYGRDAKGGVTAPIWDAGISLRLFFQRDGKTLAVMTSVGGVDEVGSELVPVAESMAPYSQ